MKSKTSYLVIRVLEGSDGPDIVLTGVSGDSALDALDRARKIKPGEEFSGIKPLVLRYPSALLVVNRGEVEEAFASSGVKLQVFDKDYREREYHEVLVPWLKEQEKLNAVTRLEVLPWFPP